MLLGGGEVGTVESTLCLIASRSCQGLLSIGIGTVNFEWYGFLFPIDIFIFAISGVSVTLGRKRIFQWTSRIYQHQ